jgi:hypothetical protein
VTALRTSPLPHKPFGSHCSKIIVNFEQKLLLSADAEPAPPAAHGFRRAQDGKDRPEQYAAS